MENTGGVALSIGNKLGEFCEARGLGRAGVEIGFLLKRDPDLLRAPDVSFLVASRLEGGRFPRGYVDGPPSLAVEVVSPGESDAEVSAKVEEYLGIGTPRVWVVRPELKTITVHRPGGDAHTYRSGETLTSDDAGFDADGFELALETVFA
jgi:Uma2 family endonuclease